VPNRRVAAGSVSSNRAAVALVRECNARLRRIQYEGPEPRNSDAENENILLRKKRRKSRRSQIRRNRSSHVHSCRANHTLRPLARAAHCTQLKSPKPVALHNRKTGMVMPEAIRLCGDLLLRSASRIRRRVLALMTLRRRSRARAQTNRAGHRARGRVQQRQRQNRHHKSRPHCAVRSHEMNYIIVPHPPETSNLPKCRYLHSSSIQSRTLDRHLTLGLNPCIMVAWNVAQFHGSRLAQPDRFSRTNPGRKSPARSRGTIPSS
jgi:hypothetical protein